MKRHILGICLILLFISIPVSYAFEIGGFTLGTQSIAYKNKPLFSSTPPAEDPSSHATSLWLGFNHQWEKNPHRLSRLGSFITKNELTDRTIVSQQNSVFRVGAFEDKGFVDMKAKFVKSSKLKFYHGAIGRDCLKVSGNMKELKSITCSKEYNMDDIGMGDMDHVQVILSGFNVKSESYERGYNTMGFGVLVDIDDNVVRATFKIKPEHEPVRPSVDDGCKDSDHCEKYEYSAKIYFTLVGYEEGDALVTKGFNSYNEVVKMSPNFAGRDHAAPYPAYSKRHDVIEGEAGYSHGLVAMRGFEFLMSDWEATKKDGRYIRELEFNIDDVNYEQDSGVADFNTNMYFSNDGAWPYGYDVTYKMWTSLIQFADQQCDQSEDEWHSGELGEGQIEFTQSLKHDFNL